MENNQLAVIVSESGLDTTKTQVLMEKFQDYFELAKEWEIKAKSVHVTSETQTAEMAMARKGRLFLREKRIHIENTRKELKEQSLREGKAIDGIANILKALIVPIEEYLDEQEKFVERKEAAEKAERERIEVERAEQARLALEEAERIAEEARRKAQEEENARIKAENERLRAENEAKELAMAQERAERERIRQEELAKVRAENEEKARIEREEQEKLRAAEKAKLEAEYAAAIQKEKEAAAELARVRKEEADKLNTVTCPNCQHQFIVNQ